MTGESNRANHRDETQWLDERVIDRRVITTGCRMAAAALAAGHDSLTGGAVARRDPAIRRLSKATRSSASTGGPSAATAPSATRGGRRELGEAASARERRTCPEAARPARAGGRARPLGPAASRPPDDRARSPSMCFALPSMSECGGVSAHVCGSALGRSSWMPRVWNPPGLIPSGPQRNIVFRLPVSPGCASKNSHNIERSFHACPTQRVERRWGDGAAGEWLGRLTITLGRRRCVEPPRGCFAAPWLP